jgi:hypothetical protein
VAERFAEIVILAEDRRQRDFVRHYLKRDGHGYRSIRLKISRSGQGSGAQYVLEQYPEEVRLYRLNSVRRRSALIAAIDADTGTVADRGKQIEGALKTAGQGKRKPSERIALLIPRRHIETWILCLTDEKVNETAKHKNKGDIDKRIRDAAKTSSTGAGRDSQFRLGVSLHSITDCKKYGSSIKQEGGLLT